MTPVKITVETGFSPRYTRYGYLADITDRDVILTLPANSAYARASIPMVSVVDIEDATADEVEASTPRHRIAGRRS